jgi:hypothetical protein
MTTRDQDGLKPAQEKFAAYLAQGCEQAEAYRKSHACTGVNPQRIAERACRLAAKAQVKARIRELLAEAKIQDIDSIGATFQQLLEDMEGARQAKNWTALAAFTRIRTQIHGMLHDNLSLNYEQTLTDEQLARRIADGDEKIFAALMEKLGDPDSFREH